MLREETCPLACSTDIQLRLNGAVERASYSGMADQLNTISSDSELGLSMWLMTGGKETQAFDADRSALQSASQPASQPAKCC